MNFRGGEFSTGEMGNFHPALTCRPSCKNVYYRDSAFDASLDALLFHG